MKEGVTKMVALAALVWAAGCGGGAGPGGGNDLAVAKIDPVDAIVDGPTRSSATTYWHSIAGITFALYADFNGIDESVNEVVPITWQKLSPQNLAVTGGSFGSLSQIMGSVSQASFTALVDGQGPDSFSIAGGTL